MLDTTACAAASAQRAACQMRLVIQRVSIGLAWCQLRTARVSVYIALRGERFVRWNHATASSAYSTPAIGRAARIARNGRATGFAVVRRRFSGR